MSMTTLISKLLPLFVTSDKGKVHQTDISSSLGLAPSSSSALLETSSLSSLEADKDREEATVKSPMIACRHTIWPMWVFTWHNSSLRLSRRASMRTSCAMMASSVTPPVEEEGSKVEGAEEAEGDAVSVYVRLGQSWTLLHLIVVASMAPITEK